MLNYVFYSTIDLILTFADTKIVVWNGKLISVYVVFDILPNSKNFIK